MGYKETHIKGIGAEGRDIREMLVEAGIAQLVAEKLKNTFPKSKLSDFDFWVALLREGTNHEVAVLARYVSGKEIIAPIIFPTQIQQLSNDQKKVIRGILDNAAKELQNGIV